MTMTRVSKLKGDILYFPVYKIILFLKSINWGASYTWGWSKENLQSSLPPSPVLTSPLSLQPSLALTSLPSLLPNPALALPPSLPVGQATRPLTIHVAGLGPNQPRRTRSDASLPGGTPGLGGWRVDSGTNVACTADGDCCPTPKA